MHVVIVGAGAVGQVYGLHLQRGGVRVSFLVKDKYAEQVRAGFSLWHLPTFGEPERVRLEDVGCFTAPDQWADDPPDQLWLAIPSTALEGDWLAPTLAAAGDALVVSLTPGLHDRDLLLAHVPEERLVQGLISLVAYSAPLPGETRFAEPGLAYWVPPVMKAPHSGPRAGEVTGLLNAGGMGASVTADVAAETALLTGLFQALIGALEASGWRFEALGRAGVADEAIRAARQAVAAAAADQALSVPGWVGLLRPWMLRMVLRMAPTVVPLPLEIYLQAHFSKVGAQTRDMLDTYLQVAREHGLVASDLDAVRGRLAATAGVD